MLGKGHIRATKEKSFLDGYLLLSLLNGRARWSSWTSSFHSPSSRLQGGQLFTPPASNVRRIKLCFVAQIGARIWSPISGGIGARESGRMTTTWFDAYSPLFGSPSCVSSSYNG